MIPQDLEAKISEIVEFLGFTLYDLAFLKENEHDILRITITHPSTPITLDSCQKVSEVLSPMLDVEIKGTTPYFLEVSSKGVERILKTKRHFALSLGERVSVRLDDKSQFEAILSSIQDDEVSFLLDSQESLSLPFSRLKKVKTILQC